MKPASRSDFLLLQPTSSWLAEYLFCSGGGGGWGRWLAVVGLGPGHPSSGEGRSVGQERSDAMRGCAEANV